jgi:DNA-binding NarL/FixJ family response regulator
MNQPNRSIRVLIVEDHFLARIALRGLFETIGGIRVAAETGSGEEAIQLYREHLPDVVLMDLRLNGTSGFEAVERIHRAHPSARILVLSNLQGSEDIHRAMKAGARGYLTKEAEGRQILDALQIVASGGRYIPKFLEDRLAERIPGAGVTPREQAVLELLAKGMSTSEIAAQIQIAEKTVRIHIGHLLEKLGARDRTQALVMALKRGIIHLDS